MKPNTLCSPLLLLLLAACPAPQGEPEAVPATTEPGPPDSDPPSNEHAAPLLCTPDSKGADDSLTLGFAAGPDFWTVRADGSQQLAHSFRRGIQDEGAIQRIMTAGSYSAVIGYSTQPPQQFYGAFGPDGELIFDAVREGALEPNIHDLYVNEEGWVAAYAGMWDGFVVTPEGLHVDLPGVIPMGPALPGGRLPVIGNEWADHERAWWTLQDGVEPLAFPAREFFLARVGDRIAYTADVGAGDIQVILEDGETVQQIDVPDDAPRAVIATTERWLLLGGASHIESNFRTIRIDAHTGSVEDLTVALPEGFWVMRHGEVATDEDGALVLDIRTEGAAGLFRSTDGQNWELLGETVYEAMELSNGHRGGSSLSRAVPNIGSPFVDEYYGELDSSWSPIEGDHFQFVRHSDGQAWLLPGAPAAEIWDFTWAEEARPAQHVSADGSCAVYWATDREGWAQLRLVQIESGPLPEELLGEAVVEGHEAGPAVFFSN